MPSVSAESLWSMGFVYKGFPYTQTSSGSTYPTVLAMGFVYKGLPFFGASGNIGDVTFIGEGNLSASLGVTIGLSATFIGDGELIPARDLDLIDVVLSGAGDLIAITASSVLDLGNVGLSGSGDLSGVIADFPFSIYYSNILEITEYYSIDASVNLNVIDNYLIPTTNVTAPGNVFEPTIILDGNYLIQNPATDPGGDISQTSLYINIKNAGLTNISACDLEGYSFTLDYSGGNFSIVSSKKMGNLGDVIDLYSFKGTITTTGQSLSNSQAGFTHKGIFGTPKLNRFFQYLMSSNTTMLPLLTNPSFLQTVSDNWQTASQVAQGIASIAGVQLQWLTFDTAVSDFRIEANMTALDAMASMASRVGAQLRWNGQDKYIVAYPDQFFGYWTPPSCSLINSDGLNNENYLDLTTGLYGLNQAILPSYSGTFNSGTKSVGNVTTPTGNFPQVQQVAKVKQKLEIEDPPLIFDLPFDYDKVYIQILVGSNGDTSGTNQVSIHNFITRDPKEFFEFDVLGFANEYVFYTSVGGAYIPQVKVDSKLFPTVNSSIDNGNFVLTIACTRRSLTPTTNVNDTQQQAAQGMSQEKYRFIKVYSGSFSCVFFGSIPIPGMWASALIPNVRLNIPNNFGGYDTVVIGDVLVEGIIESVTFNFPGFITVNVAQYKRLLYNQIPFINYGNNQ